jgi:serine/threonine-protein kinase
MQDPSMGIMQSDRNLLFGVLALQLDFISRDALVSAMNEWLLRKDVPLADLLLQRGELEHGERDALEAVVDRHVARHEGDVSKSLGVPASQAILRDVIQRAPAREIQTALLQGIGDTPQSDYYATEPVGMGEAASNGHRFKILRRHARGGLGEVFAALDQELDREVALKQIQSKYADDANGRERFIFEAKITGKLEHPGVVPVYGLGAYADGRPYYAMQFIDQGSLQDEIRKCHADGRTAENGCRLTLRDLLNRFISACNTIEFAHDRGVLHRDIKPANIMLGKFGETFVVDWGLAKVYEPGATDRTLVNAPSIPSNFSASHTLEGQAVGTVPYMSTEQAAGKVASLTPATDVYSLGATLYVLLTNQVPFTYPGNPPHTPAVSEILRRKPLGDFVRPRVFNPKCSKALEAICLKAMAIEPRDRYASAAELAKDVERYLADEPVAAYQDNLVQRAARWTRKHRTLAGAAAVSLLLITTTALIAVVFISSARRAQAVARESATKNYRKARTSVDTLLRAVGEELDSVPGAQRLRKRLLEEATKAYEEFVRDQGEDLELRMEAAWSQHQLAFVYKQLQDLDHALKQHEAAARQFESLLDSPLHEEATYGLASTKTEWGRIVSDVGEHDRAKELHSQSHELFDELVQNHRSPDYILGRAKTCINLGVVLFDQGLRDRAVDAFSDAIADLQVLSRERAKDMEQNLQVAFNLARAYNNLGYVKQDLQEVEEAETAYRSAHSTALELRKARPQSPRYGKELVLAQTNLADLLLRTDRDSTRVIELLQSTVDECKKLVRDNPGVLAFKEALTNGATGLAKAQSTQMDHVSARRTINFAIAQANELLDSGENLPLYHATAAKAHYVSAQQYDDAAAFESAEQEFVRAIEHWSAALKQDQKPDNLAGLLDSSQGRIEMLLRLKDYQRATVAIEEFSRHWPVEQAAEYGLTGGVYMFLAAWLAANDGNFRFAAQRIEQALRYLNAAEDKSVQ